MAIFDLNLVAYALAFLLFYLATAKFARLHFWFRLYQTLPGEKDYSILYGNLHKVPKDGESKIRWARDKMDNDPTCRKLMRYWHGPIIPAIAVYHPDTVKPILKNNLPKGRGFGRGLEYLAKWLGDGLICINDPALWQRNRKMLTHAFHFEVLRSYNAVFNSACDVMIDILSEKADRGESFDITEVINLCVFEGILRCSMGCGEDVQINKNSRYHKYIQSVRALTETWTDRVRTVWMWPDILFNRCATGRRFNSSLGHVHSFNEDIIRTRRQVLEEQGPPKGRKLDFIEVLLTARDDNGHTLTDREIRDEVDTFMAAGYDTTATATPWLLYNLAKHPEYQRKVQAEVDDLDDDHGQQDNNNNGGHADHINWQHLNQLPLLTQCAKESNRLYPPVPFVLRVLPEEMVLDGHIIPKGTLVSVFINNIHRHPDVWECPDEFQPQRFSSDKGRDAYAYIPFSAGPRNCLGQNFAMNEMKVITGRILKRFNIELDPKAPPVERSGLLILKPANGIWVKLTRREDQQQQQQQQHQHTTHDDHNNKNNTINDALKTNYVDEMLQNATE